MVYRTGNRLISDTTCIARTERYFPVEINRTCKGDLDFVYMGKRYHIFETQNPITTPLDGQNTDGFWYEDGYSRGYLVGDNCLT